MEIEEEVLGEDIDSDPEDYMLIDNLYDAGYTYEDIPSTSTNADGDGTPEESPRKQDDHALKKLKEMEVEIQRLQRLCSDKDVLCKKLSDELSDMKKDEEEMEVAK